MSTITRLVGKRTMPADDFFFNEPADDEPAPDDWQATLTPVQWMIARANREAIQKLRTAVADKHRHVVVIVRAFETWQGAAINLVERILEAQPTVFDLDDGQESIDIESVVHGLGFGNVVLRGNADDVMPDVFAKLAAANVDATRVTRTEATAYLEHRWPGCAVVWPRKRSLRSVGSSHLSTALLQADKAEDVFRILDAMNAHDAAQAAKRREREEEAHRKREASGAAAQEAAVKPAEAPTKPAVDAKLERAMKTVVVDRPAMPLLADLAGYGAASVWAQDLAGDIESFKNGEINWSDVNPEPFSSARLAQGRRCSQKRWRQAVTCR